MQKSSLQIKIMVLTNHEEQSRHRIDQHPNLSHYNDGQAFINFGARIR
jgi:hypothetical protein